MFEDRENWVTVGDGIRRSATSDDWTREDSGGAERFYENTWTSNDPEAAITTEGWYFGIIPGDSGGPLLQGRRLCGVAATLDIDPQFGRSRYSAVDRFAFRILGAVHEGFVVGARRVECDGGRASGAGCRFVRGYRARRFHSSLGHRSDGGLLRHFSDGRL